MFETFNCPCMYLSNQSVLSAYSIGMSTGLLLIVVMEVLIFLLFSKDFYVEMVLLIFLLQERKFLKIYINYFQLIIILNLKCKKKV